MKIAVDCRMLGSSGVGVYLREALSCMLRSCHEFVLFGDYEKIKTVVQGTENITAEKAAIYPFVQKTFSVKELVFGLPAKLRKAVNSCHVYYTPFFNVPAGIRIPVFTTIHDVVFPDVPELTGKVGLAVRMWFFRRAVSESQGILTVSEFSKSRIQHYFGCEKPVAVTYNGIPDYLLQPPQSVVSPSPSADFADFVAAKPSPFILFVGNIKKHKGLPILSEALDSCRKEGLDINLVIVGNADNFRTQESSFSVENRQGVFFTGYVSDTELQQYMRQAALLVQPSLYEGFGIPPLEAMSQGTPVLASDIPVFKEIYSGFPITFFKAGDAKDLSAKLMTLFGGGKVPERISLTAEQRSKYTYQKTADIILDFLEKGYKTP